MPADPVSPFLAVLLLLGVAVVVATLILVTSGVVLPRLFKPRNPVPDKLTTYECGVPPFQDDARRRYSVKFYTVAMLFILFDVEAMFLMPWAVNFKAAPWTFWVMLSFFATLLVGYIYAWGKGALDWER